jgi:hypothetical protein
MDALAGIEYVRFLGLDQLDRLKEVIDQLSLGASWRWIVAYLLGLTKRPHCRSAIRKIFERSGLHKSDNVLAREVGCSTKHLRVYLRKDIGLTPATLRRWSLLLHATELKLGGMREPELSMTLGVASTTLNRSARALLAMSFGAAARAGHRYLGSKLMQMTDRADT